MITKHNLLLAGMSLAATSSSWATARYVDGSSANPTPPYTNWATAAHVIQQAVDAAVAGDEIVVTDGAYATGGRALSRVAVEKTRLTVRSVNGPKVTVINGSGTVRCVYLTNDTVMVGFTLTNGWADSGGGVYCESTSAALSNCVLTGNAADLDGGGAYGGTLNNCTLISNSASGDDGYGGGASCSALNNCTLTGNSANGYYGYGGGVAGTSEKACILNNCTLTGNSAGYGGGGAFWAALNNCTLTANSASAWGGGAHSSALNNCTLTGNLAGSYGGGAAGDWWDGPSTLNNCIVYFNTATNGANYEGDYVALSYCCTTPMPTNGVGNITNTPLFMDYAGGNLRLQSNSPCINAGLNAYAPGLADLDSLPRIINGTVDMGAYEYQGPGSLISYAWLQQYGLPTDGSADFTDPDRDGLNNWQEWRCLTDPTNALSLLRLLSAAPIGTNVTVTWQSVAGVSYFLERSTNLASPFTPLATNIPGQPGTTSFTDIHAAGASLFFYRVGVGQ